MVNYPQAAGLTLADLVGRLGLPHDRVAIEHNLEIAHRGQWAATALHEGDRLEIVRFVGGG
jgi:sulfur carrier protein